MRVFAIHRVLSAMKDAFSDGRVVGGYVDRIQRGSVFDRYLIIMDRPLDIVSTVGIDTKNVSSTA